MNLKDKLKRFFKEYKNLTSDKQYGLIVLSTTVATVTAIITPQLVKAGSIEITYTMNLIFYSFLAVLIVIAILEILNVLRYILIKIGRKYGLVDKSYKF